MKYPNMKIVVPHGCWPHVHTALAVAIRCPNVYLMPDCYIYIDGFALSDEYIKAANTYLKYRILYASSYPVRSLSQCLRGWKRAASPTKPFRIRSTTTPPGFLVKNKT